MANLKLILTDNKVVTISETYYCRTGCFLRDTIMILKAVYLFIFFLNFGVDSLVFFISQFTRLKAVYTKIEVYSMLPCGCCTF